ncbi:MAG TPA: methylated-DNA--[protein]-cysteine S-methyltransferase [Solirubrobacteraceae bacterium]|nr:methylated-DNA--[protein]-cysteine S-methyltransferase [Solirubrobacteraceae bacterium]
MIQTVMDSPLGVLTLAGPDPETLARLHFGEAALGEPQPQAFAAVRAQLAEYFAGTRRGFTVALALTGSDWERRVWSQLTQIPYGETRTYAQIAAAACERTGARAARAVGRANHHNPVAIIVPCHRVIGADGSLTGFAGGLEAKRRLLDLEAGRLALI